MERPLAPKLPQSDPILWTQYIFYVWSLLVKFKYSSLNINDDRCLGNHWNKETDNNTSLFEIQSVGALHYTSDHKLWQKSISMWILQLDKQETNSKCLALMCLPLQCIFTHAIKLSKMSYIKL